MNCVWRMGAHGNRVSNTMSQNFHHTSSDIQVNIKRDCELGLDGKVFEIFHFQEFADARVLAEGSKSAGSPAPFPRDSFMRLELI